MVLRVFIFIFCLETTVIKKRFDENNFCRCYDIFLSEVSFRKYAVMLKVFSQQLRGTLTTAFERHLAIEDCTGIDQHRCQACAKAFNLLLYASLSLTQS